MMEYSDANYKEGVLESDIPVLVDVWATWCPSCPSMFPIVADVERSFDGKIAVGKINADTSSAFVAAYGIMSLPTFLLFVKGDVVWMTTGKTDRDSLIREITKYV
jgi:thioredoxin 1